MRSWSKTPSPTQSTSYASYATDERWRIAAAYASTGTGGTASATLLERYVHHAAGQAGRGGSSYIDAVVLRDRDLDAEASSTTDGGTDPLEERTYILQNWRADVVATARRNGSVIEKMQYTAYGAAVTHLYHGTVRGDFNANGGVDGSDLEAFELAWANSEPSTDVNFDGGIDSADWDAFLVIWATGELSTDIYESHAGACQTTAVRFGYAGYVRDGSVNGERVDTDAAAGLYHVRHRVYDPELGRWTRRDPAGYVDGAGLIEYSKSAPVLYLDPTGLGCKIAFKCQLMSDVADGLRGLRRSCTYLCSEDTSIPRWDSRGGTLHCGHIPSPARVVKYTREFYSCSKDFRTTADVWDVVSDAPWRTKGHADCLAKCKDYSEKMSGVCDMLPEGIERILCERSSDVLGELCREYCDAQSDPVFGQAPVSSGSIMPF